jgi:two-component system LytT family response regulator
MITCIAIDDEPKALDIIRNHISKIDYLRLEETFTDPHNALAYIDENTPDLVLLDINMPDLDGMKFIKHLRHKPQIIFTTAHSEYALQSYEVEAVDYLLKPFDFSRFLAAISKAKEKIQTGKPTPEFFFANTGNQKKKLFYKDIIYVSAEGNYVMYHTVNDKTLIRASISETLEQLPKQMFIQIHRSTIVSIYHIHKVEDNHIYMHDSKHQISVTYRDAFLKKINMKR